MLLWLTQSDPAEKYSLARYGTKTSKLEFLRCQWTSHVFSLFRYKHSHMCTGTQSKQLTSDQIVQSRLPIFFPSSFYCVQIFQRALSHTHTYTFSDLFSIVLVCWLFSSCAPLSNLLWEEIFYHFLYVFIQFFLFFFVFFNNFKNNSQPSSPVKYRNTVALLIYCIYIYIWSQTHIKAIKWNKCVMCVYVLITYFTLTSWNTTQDKRHQSQANIQILYICIWTRPWNRIWSLYQHSCMQVLFDCKCMRYTAERQSVAARQSASHDDFIAHHDTITKVIYFAILLWFWLSGTRHERLRNENICFPPNLISLRRSCE